MKQGSCALLKARARQALTGRYLTAMGALVLTDLIYAFMIAFLIPTGFTGRLAGLSLQLPDHTVSHHPAAGGP